MPGWINVPMKMETRDKLDKIRKEGQSYDSVINELMMIRKAEEIKQGRTG